MLTRFLCSFYQSIEWRLGQNNSYLCLQQERLKAPKTLFKIQPQQNNIKSFLLNMFSLIVGFVVIFERFKSPGVGAFIGVKLILKRPFQVWLQHQPRGYGYTLSDELKGQSMFIKGSSYKKKVKIFFSLFWRMNNSKHPRKVESLFYD